MQPNAMIQTLKTLKLHGMAQAVGELASQGSPAYQGAEGILDSLLKAEVAEREVRSVSYQVRWQSSRRIGTCLGLTSARVLLTRHKFERFTKVCLLRTLRTWCSLVGQAQERRI